MRAGWKPVRGLHCVLLAALAGPAAQGESLDRFIERALANNRDYLAALQRVREAEALLRQAGVRPAPTIEGDGGSSRLLGSPDAQEYSLGYFHTFETGGKRGKRINVAQLGVELARAEAAERRRELMLEVRQRAADALSAARRLSVLADLRHINTETLRLLAARVNEGDAAPLEKQLLEADVNRAEVDRITAQARLEGAMLELRRVGAAGDGDGAPGDGPLVPASLAASAELARTALASRPDLRALQLAAEQARSGVQAARAESSPNLTASARYAYRSNAFDQYGYDRSGALTRIRDRENMLAFGISVPLFTTHRNKAAVEAAVSREEQAGLHLAYLNAAIPAEVEGAYRKWSAARKALEVFDSVLKQSESNLRVIRQAWELGHLRFFDVLNEQRRLTDLRLARVDAEADLMRAAADLAHSVGGDL